MGNNKKPQVTSTPPQVPAGSGIQPQQASTASGDYKKAALPEGSTKGYTPRYSSSFDRPDINATKVITNSIYQRLMGRDATEAEIIKYHNDYLNYAASHPTSSSTTMMDETGSYRSSTSTQTGLSESDYITNLVRGSADAKEYQAATTYFDAMANAMNIFKGGY